MEKGFGSQYGIANGQVDGIIVEARRLRDAGNGEGALEMISDASNTFYQLSRKLSLEHDQIWTDVMAERKKIFDTL